MPIGQMRSHFRKLNINNNHILGIHYPDKHIVAPLIHNDYTEELEQQLAIYKIKTTRDYNPCNGSNLKDPKYAELSLEEKSNIAFNLHCECMSRALQHICAPVKYAVARYLYRQGWIYLTELKDILPRAAYENQAAALFQSDDDQMNSLIHPFHIFPIYALNLLQSR